MLNLDLRKMKKQTKISAGRIAPDRIFFTGQGGAEEQLFDRKGRGSDKVYRAFGRKVARRLIPSMAAEYA
jgi:hypothetical protein